MSEPVSCWSGGSRTVPPAGGTRPRPCNVAQITYTAGSTAAVPTATAPSRTRSLGLRRRPIASASASPGTRPRNVSFVTSPAPASAPSSSARSSVRPCRRIRTAASSAKVETANSNVSGFTETAMNASAGWSATTSPATSGAQRHDGSSSRASSAVPTAVATKHATDSRRISHRRVGTEPPDPTW